MKQRPEVVKKWDDAFAARAADLLAFIRRHGRVPRVRSSDREERALAYWFVGNRALHRKGELPVGRSRMLRDVEEAWFQLSPVASDFRAAVRRVKAFTEVRGRLPLWDIRDEEACYSDLRHIRRLYCRGALSKAELGALRSIPGALKVTRKDPDARLAELQAWCAEHRRLPRQQFHKLKTSPAEEVEAGLGQWLYRHVNRSHEPVETPETAGRREAILALKETYPASGEVGEEIRAEAVVDFIVKSGRLPCVRREHKLYEYAFRIRNRYRHGGAFRPATVRMLDLTENLPNFLESQWDGELDRLIEFVSAHGRLPTASKQPGRGRPTTEHQLAKWLRRELGNEPTVTDPNRKERLTSLIATLQLPVAA